MYLLACTTSDQVDCMSRDSSAEQCNSVLLDGFDATGECDD